MEALTKYWGFYLVAAVDSNSVGVQDLHIALDEVVRHQEWVSDLSRVPSEDRASQNDLNSLIASKKLRKVLAARIVVFQLFLEVAIQVDGALLEKHKRIWLLFQSFDPLEPLGTAHPFVRVMGQLHRASDEALDTLIRRLDKIRDTYMPQTQFILAVDEAQRLAMTFPHSFISSTDPELPRSMIREVAKVSTILRGKLVVAGTGLSLEDLSDALASGVSKFEEVDLFHGLGMFDTPQKLKSFFQRYIPASILESTSWLRLQQRIREYLLGRSVNIFILN